MEWTIAKKTGLLITGALSVTLIVTFATLLTSSRNQSQESTETYLSDCESLLMHSLTFAMGQGITDFTPYVQKVQQIENIRELGIHPVNRIRANSEDKMDSVEREVLTSKKGKMFRDIYHDEPVMRSVQSIVADASCVSCHGGNVGELFAVVSLRSSLKSIEANQRSMTAWTVTLALTSIGITIFLVWFLLRMQVSRPLHRLIAQTEKIAAGDLTVVVTESSKDEVGRLAVSFNDMVASLRNTLDHLSQATAAVASASSQISSSTEQMAAGAQEQMSQAEEVAAAVEEMAKTILENSRNAGETASSVRRFREKAEEGGRVVSRTVQEMKTIAGVVDRSAATVKTLGKSSDQIGEIVKVIDDIADQTNLLALNATIEAARAGEHGYGFAVVADEVRKLAERTATATQEISRKIQQIQSDTTGAAASMEEGTKEVNAGIALADSAGESLKDVVEGIQSVTDMIAHIASASEQQSSTSEQISKAVEGISTVTNQTATGTQQIARAAGDLNKLTENLTQLIGRFQLSESDAKRPMHLN